MSKVIRFKVDNDNGAGDAVVAHLVEFHKTNEDCFITISNTKEAVRVIIICDSNKAFNLGVLIGKIVMSYNVEYVFELVSHSCRTVIDALTNGCDCTPSEVATRITNDLLGSWK